MPGGLCLMHRFEVPESATELIYAPYQYASPQPGRYLSFGYGNQLQIADVRLAQAKFVFGRVTDFGDYPYFPPRGSADSGIHLLTMYRPVIIRIRGNHPKARVCLGKVCSFLSGLN
jgi:hypothetical protein